MFRRPSKTTNLRTQLGKALKANRLHEALDLYELIEKQQKDEPRWSHRRADLLQRMNRKADAVLAYERAVDLYAAKGFVARAAAMAKVIMAIDPNRSDVLDRYLASLRSFASTPDNYSASITDRIVIPMCEGVIAFENGDFEQAVECLWPLRDQWSPIGGSHAQRDIFTQILIDATIGAKQFSRARTLLSQRLTLRPQSVGSWNKYAQVQQALGNAERAKYAAARAATIA